MRRFFSRALALIAALCLLLSAAAAQDRGEILYAQGDKDSALRDLKYRLYELGYFTDTSFARRFTERTREAVIRFQEVNGLPAEGDWSELDQACLDSGEALPCPSPTPTASAAPSPSPEATPSPSPTAAVSSTPAPTMEESASAAASSEDVAREENEVLLKEGDKGEDVLAMKQRLYELGYFTAGNLSRTYSEKTVQAMRAFQEQNGLPVTGEYSAADRDALFSDGALRYVAPTPTPSPTPEPMPTVRPLTGPDLPQLDEEGFLAGEGEYVLEDDEGGQWCYLSSDIQIRINRYQNEQIPLCWFETEILLRNGETLRNAHTENRKANNALHFVAPFDLAEENHFILAFTDDFYDYRVYHREKVGTVIRDGQLLYDRPYPKRYWYLPNLDMLALYADGSMRCWECGEKTGEELLAEGAVNVYCFGPIILRDGQKDDMLKNRFRETFPRQFLGMIEPNHYLLLTVQGRTANSVGICCEDAADMMLARGVTEALTLDGGNTMALIFRGRMLNDLARWKSRKYVRNVSSLIGVGTYNNEENDLNDQNDQNDP